MAQKWITKKGRYGENKHIPIAEGKRKIREREILFDRPEQSNAEKEKVENLEKKAREMLKDISNVSDVDMLLDGMKRYSGLLSDYSPSNAILIQEYDPDYTVVRSNEEWNRFGYILKDDASKIPILVPIGAPKKAMPGQIVKFIEQKRSEGISDEMIDNLVHEKFGKEVGGYTHTFQIGYVYDKRDVLPNPKKKQLQEWNIDLSAEKLYEKAKNFAKQNNIVVIEGDTGNARGYASNVGAEIHIMKAPGEDREAVNTMLHELGHSLLGHFKIKISQEQKEAEAQLTAYIVATHYGIDLQKETKAYIGGWLDKKGDRFKEENLDRVLKTAKNIINGIDRMNKGFYTDQ